MDERESRDGLLRQGDELLRSSRELLEELDERLQEGPGQSPGA